jgi:hypothetical protein
MKKLWFMSLVILLLIGLSACINYPREKTIGQGGTITGIGLDEQACIPETPNIYESGFNLFTYDGILDGSYVIFLPTSTVPSYIPIGKSFAVTALASNYEELEINNIKVDMNGNISFDWTRIK